MHTTSVANFILKVIKPFKWHLIGMLLVSIIVPVKVPVQAILIKCILDNSSQAIGLSNTLNNIYPYLILYFALTVLVLFMNIFEEYLWINFSPYIRKNIGSMLINILLQQSYSFYQNNFAGSLANMLNNCLSAIPRLIRIFNDNLFGTTLTIIISCYILAQVDYKFAFALICWASLYIISALIMAPKVKKLSADVAQEASSGIGHIIDIFSNIISVKLFSTTQREEKFVVNNFTNWLNKVKSSSLILVNLFVFQTISFLIFQILCFYWLIISNEAPGYTAGDFILVSTISLSIYSNLSGIARTIADFSENLGILSQAMATIYKPAQIIDMPGAGALLITKGEIVFDKVSFHYKGATPLFQNISVRIEAGQKVGLVGYSGSGKSTFVSLLLRLHEINSGQIRIDGQNIHDVTQDSLHRAIAMISQEPTLFHRSLRENINYGRLEASMAEVITAAKQADADDFINALPQGYESMVGERGIKLSGGQRQRITIARAILKNAPIVILDEATSQLDSITENTIQKSLINLMQGKTTIVIAHRLSTLLNMDRILVFEKGQIVADGPHQELITQNGLYKRMWEAQIGGFLPA